jgi:hypothetical protein
VQYNAAHCLDYWRWTSTTSVRLDSTAAVGVGRRSNPFNQQPRRPRFRSTLASGYKRATEACEPVEESHPIDTYHLYLIDWPRRRRTNPNGRGLRARVHTNFRVCVYGVFIPVEDTLIGSMIVAAALGRCGASTDRWDGHYASPMIMAELSCLVITGK